MGGTSYHAEVLRERFMYVEVLIDHLKFFGETQELRIRKSPGCIRHHFKIFHVGNIASRMPPEKAAMERRNDDVSLEHHRVFIPNVDVLLEKRLVVGKTPSSLPRIAFCYAWSIWSASTNRRKTDGRNVCAELRNPFGNMDILRLPPPKL